MVEAIFFDIDGTLVPMGETKIPQNTLETLKQLQEKGVKLFVATGRPPCFIDHVKNLFPFDGFLTANGQYCFDKDNHLIAEKYIPTSSVKEVMPYIKERQLPVIYATIESCYRNEYINEEYDLHWPLVDETILDKQVVQMMVHISPQEDEEFLKHLPYTKTLRWTDRFADVVPVEGGKDCGINHIIDYFNIPLEHVMAFGDGGNDITMLAHVPYGVAMGNAEDEVKKHANYVTDKSENDGITKACVHFGLL